ncbi:conserved hypothetical protein [Candidatus Desulfarcum epimagneticum]|uniref:Uncharacterized protein n=1 Tax=uncultured Desulfobacteraceae bacterium TaxID=218296 RepID=A0A484HG22_9BACT|nr:conserved hypothetical protein [uncultured Desulfobacteraceae bacterium]
MEVDTQGRGGIALRKTVTVTTSDPLHPTLRLYISGRVKKLFEITPGVLFLKGDPDREITASADIVPAPIPLDQGGPLKITGIEAPKGGRHIKVKLGEKKDGGWRLTVTNQKKEPGRYSDKITLLTSSALKPRVDIHVHGRLERKGATKNQGVEKKE